MRSRGNDRRFGLTRLVETLVKQRRDQAKSFIRKSRSASLASFSALKKSSFKDTYRQTSEQLDQQSFSKLRVGGVAGIFKRGT